MGWEEVSKKGTYSMDGCLPKVEHNGQIEGLGNGCGTGMHSV